MISTSKVNLYIHCLYLLILQNYLFKWILLEIFIYYFINFINFKYIFNLILCDRLVNLNEINDIS